MKDFFSQPQNVLYHADWRNLPNFRQLFNNLYWVNYCTKIVKYIIKIIFFYFHKSQFEHKMDCFAMFTSLLACPPPLFSLDKIPKNISFAEGSFSSRRILVDTMTYIRWIIRTYLKRNLLLVLIILPKMLITNNYLCLALIFSISFIESSSSGWWSNSSFPLANGEAWISLAAGSKARFWLVRTGSRLRLMVAPVTVWTASGMAACEDGNWNKILLTMRIFSPA